MTNTPTKAQINRDIPMKIVQEFKGFIDGIEIDNRVIYYGLEYILDNYERITGQAPSKEVVEILHQEYCGSINFLMDETALFENTWIENMEDAFYLTGDINKTVVPTSYKNETLSDLLTERKALTPEQQKVEEVQQLPFLDYKQIQEFKATIEGVEVDNQQLYDTVRNILLNYVSLVNAKPDRALVKALIGYIKEFRDSRLDENTDFMLVEQEWKRNMKTAYYQFRDILKTVIPFDYEGRILGDLLNDKNKEGKQ